MLVTGLSLQAILIPKLINHTMNCFLFSANFSIIVTDNIYIDTEIL
jgi:hypothetical protein